MSNPLVSVLIPVFNRADLIASTLGSVFAQEYRPIELVIVDDGSTDDSFTVIEDWKKKHEDDTFKVILEFQVNAGAPAARNRAMAICSGDFLQFLDSDDTLETQKIQQQIRSLRQSNADIAVCDYRYVFHDVSRNRVVLNNGDLLNRVIFGHSLFTMTPLIKRDLVIGRLSWECKLKRQQDVDFLLRAMLLSNSYVYTPGVWCNYIHHDQDQISDSYRRTAPPFLRQIWSLVNFYFSNRPISPKERRRMVALAIISLFWRALKHHLGGIGRRLLPERQFNAIRAFLFS